METLLGMLSVGSVDKVAKRFDFHWTTLFSLDLFYHDQTSVDIIRPHSTNWTRYSNESIFHSDFFRVNNGAVWRKLKYHSIPKCSPSSVLGFIRAELIKTDILALGLIPAGAFSREAKSRIYSIKICYKS